MEISNTIVISERNLLKENIPFQFSYHQTFDQLDGKLITKNRVIVLVTVIPIYRVHWITEYFQIDKDNLFIVSENQNELHELALQGYENIYDSIHSTNLDFKLFQANQAYRPPLNTDDISLLYFDKNRTILSVNSKFESIFNIEKEQLIGSTLSQLFPCINFERLLYFVSFRTEIFLANETTPCIVRFQEFTVANKKTYFLSIRLEFQTKDHNPDKLIQENQFLSIVNHSPDVIMRFNKKHEHIFVNDAVISSTGLEPKDFLGKTHEQMGFPPNLVTLWEENIQLAFDTGLPQRIEFNLEGINGLTYFEWRLIPEFDKAGNVQTIITVARDFTEQKKAEKTSQELAEVIKHAKESITLTDLDGKINYINEQFTKQTGYSEEDVLGKNLFFYNINESQEVLDPIFAIIKQKQSWSGILQGTKRYGNPIVEDVMIFPIINEQNKVEKMASIRRNITAEFADRKENISLYKYPEKNPYPVIRVDYNGKILYANPASFEFTAKFITTGGWKDILASVIQKNEVIEKEIWLEEECFLFSFVPLQEENFVNIYGINITGLKNTQTSLHQVHKKIKAIQDNVPIAIYRSDHDGALHSINNAMVHMFGYDTKEELMQINSSELYVNPEDRKALLTILISKKMVKDYELHLKRKDGTKFWGSFEIRYVQEKGQEYQDGTIRDITKRKDAEKQLRHAQKMEAIGTLAGGIAHDFNNIIMAITGFSEMILQDISANDDHFEHVQRILISGNRAKDMVKQLLAFSRQHMHQKTNILLHKALKEAVSLIQATFPATIAIQTDISNKCGYVLADPTQINQVIMNLSANAKHAMTGKDGILKISLKKHIQKERTIALLPGQYAKLSISDNGYGMSEEVKTHIFEPFYTTKSVDEGTGLGLATVHGIMSQSNGAIIVESELDHGTTFHLFFPIVKENEVLNNKKVLTNSTLVHGSGNIMVIDDELMVGNLIKKTLERAGYNVTYFSESPVAMETFLQNPDYYQLVITDQTMPKIPGNIIAESFLKIREDMPIILCSGYSEMIDETKAKEIGIKHYISKPISIGELTQIVKIALTKEGQNESD